MLGEWLPGRNPTGGPAGCHGPSLDLFRGYATALAVQLPAAVRVLDRFHVVKLGLASSMMFAAASSSAPPATAAAPVTCATASVGCCAGAATGSPAKAEARLQAGLIAGDPDGDCGFRRGSGAPEPRPGHMIDNARRVWASACADRVCEQIDDDSAGAGG